MSTRVLAAVVVLLAVAVGLAATNPTMGDYKIFVEGLVDRTVERMDRTGGRNLDRQRDRSQIKHLAASLLGSATVRRNYGFMSFFETKLFGIDIVVLGIANRFVPVKGTEDLTEKIRRQAPSSGF